jgi:hypothetical protein
MVGQLSVGLESSCGLVRQEERAGKRIESNITGKESTVSPHLHSATGTQLEGLLNDVFFL